MKRNIVTSLIFAIIYAAIGVLLWGALSYYADIRLGIVGILIGYMVGVSLRKSNADFSIVSGIVAVAITAVAILCGEFASLIMLVGKEFDMTIMESISSIDYKAALNIIVESSGAESLIIYGLSLYQAFKIGSQAGYKSKADDEVLEDIA